MNYLYHGWARFAPKERWYVICESDDPDWCREKLAAWMTYHLPSRKKTYLISTVVLPGTMRPVGTRRSRLSDGE